MSKPLTIEQEIHARIKRTELFAAMRSSGNYEDDLAIIDIILEMRERARNGGDPEELLYEEGFEPDYVFDLID